MALPSPPKPWEAKASSYLKDQKSSIGIPPRSFATTAPASSSPATTKSLVPNLPARPASLTSVSSRALPNYGSYPQLGAYSGIGGYNNYASPYARYSAMRNPMYGGIGSGYGSLYGGMGGMYGAGMGQPGMMGADPNDPNSLTNSFSQSTQATFQIIESIVGAFQGVAQMLDSTYMATHSSFFAMIAVAEQFTNLRNTLGSILGIFTILRWLKTLFAKVTGRPPPADATSLTPSAFASFRGLPAASAPNNLTSPSPSPSRKPFLVFVLAAFGLPYLMSKLIRTLSQQSSKNSYNDAALGPNNTILPPPQPLDPSKLEFCRVLYDYSPERSIQAGIHDLAVKKGDLVAVLCKTDPTGQPSDWWQCRSRDSRIGYLPGVYLESVKKSAEIEPRAMTLSSDEAGDSRSNSLKVEEESTVRDLKAK